MDLAAKHEPGGQRGADVLGAEGLDHNAIDWSRIRRSIYEVQQRFRYQYAAPISDLKQRLVVVPRPVHGDQRLLHHQLKLSEARFRRRIRVDRFGNVVLQISIPQVEEAIDFDVSLILERSTAQGPHLEKVTGQALDIYLLPSALTQPDAALRAAAAELALSGEKGVELAIAASGWVYRHMSYSLDRTGVHTTAGEALAEGHGVCQDYAHVMLALCRLLGLPARYVSGHLVGEGGTHAWVEVLMSTPGKTVEILAWDPTHDRPADLRYLTVSVGRDYHDVAPVSGTYRAPHPGSLSTSRRVRVTQLERAIAA